ncbi:hypothetical protein JY651_34410 [Pyxidicoccus parkwayensis]|uniref:Uncharacterized protein n=1 Tax=Pyxidicoccus parkwayensis TaxID=2813578 RepID=A0ABX7NN84_9BACT|nr:hypothetical protein [Pyxidicoccus parkwaysis]QSQ20325.1 hypothetical protein JY651_34410 [Pyxidicoccus parkwaysis]
MKRTLSLVAGLGLSLVSLGAFAATPKPATEGQKPAAAAPAKSTKGKKAKAHTASTKPATTPSEGSGTGN